MKFILSKELGKLARWLRILGFDAVYFNQDNTAGLLLLALREQRLIITKNKSLYDTVSAKSVYIKEEELSRQLKKVVDSLSLKIEEEKMFSRCAVCNQILEPVAKKEIEKRVPPYVYKTQEEFRVCRSCRRVYWPGTHWGNIKEAISKLYNC